MATLSMVTVAGLAYEAGLRNPVALSKAVAIATAESGRNPAKLGDTTIQTAEWGPSIGLWQIRSRKDEKGKGSTRDAEKLTDPAFNAKSMMTISGGGNSWSPWSVTHPTDPAGFLRYQAALPLATAAVGQMLGQKGTAIAAGEAEDAAGAALEPISQLASTVSEAVQTPVRIANWLTQSGTWQRIAYLLAGGVILVVGLGLVVRGPATAAAGKVVQAVVPIGRAAKAVKKVAS